MLVKRLLLVALLGLLVLPFAAWSFVKPVRLLAPELSGVTCSQSVCVDDVTGLSQAEALYESAREHVSSRLTPLKERPVMVFCSAAACYRSFGGGSERAITYPKLGSLIAPGSWSPHFVRHELIHALQAQELGAVRMMRGPEWFREGMAYSVSDPPDQDMPPQFQNYRTQYEAWAAGLGKEELWSVAARL